MSCQYSDTDILQVKNVQRDKYSKEVKALEHGESEYEVIFHMDFHQMSLDASTFRQEMVLVVFQRPPGLTCGEKGKHHFFGHYVGGSASMSNDTGFMVVAMACALEGGRSHLNNDILLTP